MPVIVSPQRCASRRLLALACLLLVGCATGDPAIEPNRERTVRFGGAEAGSTAGTRIDTPPVRIKEDLPGLEGLETLYYRVKHLETVRLAAMLARWKSEKGLITPFTELNMLVIQDRPEHLDAIQQVLENLDVYTAQVKIEAKVIEIQRTHDFEFGLEFRADRTPVTGGMLRRIEGVFNTQSFLDGLIGAQNRPDFAPFAFQGATMQFAAVGKVFKELGDTELIIRALEDEGYAEILSSPNIVVHSGHQAELSTLTEFPIEKLTFANGRDTVTTDFKRIGVTFTVKPLVVGRKTVLLQIHPQVSSISGFTTSGTSGAAVPIVSQRSAQTVVEVQDGERLVIGGLFERRVIQDRKSVPILGSIPLLGRFFGNINDEKVKTEIVFVLECHILHQGTRAGRPTLRDPRKK